MRKERLSITQVCLAGVPFMVAHRLEQVITLYYDTVLVDFTM